MKLRNKKTGDIYELNEFCLYDDKGFAKRPFLKSLAELNEEWEDVPEEPKKHYEILGIGVVVEQTNEEDDIFRCAGQREIGNFFETKEEAEKAVEKLKAWKRLKDKGFEIENWTNDIGDNYYKTGDVVLNLNNVRNRDWNPVVQISEIKNDLDLLFGGEE